METIFAGQYQVSGFRAGFMRPLGPQDGGVDGGLLSATLFRLQRVAADVLFAAAGAVSPRRR